MRFVRIVVIVLVSVAAVLILYSCLQSRIAPASNTGLPVDLKTIIPSTWTVVPNQFKTCDFDGDGEQEYLVVYSYDPATAPSGLLPTVTPPPVVAGRSLIGGVIYDTQVNRVPQAPGNQSPYRPAFLVPYKLLPDIYGGKGQGYLGQNSATVNLLPGVVNNAPCQAKEIAIFGTSYDTLPTNLSIFRWAGDPVGYVNNKAYFQAGTWLQAYGPNRSAQPASPASPILEVYTYNTLNQRSLLCSIQHYTRQPNSQNPTALPPGLEFTEVTTDYTIDFCYGPPKDPAYPEGVVVALLRGQNPDANTPTGGSYFVSGAVVPQELAFLTNAQRIPVRTISVSMPGSLGLYPPQGVRYSWSPPGTPSPTPQVWWSSAITESARVDPTQLMNPPYAQVKTEIILNNENNETRQALWTLVSMASEQANSDTRWRVIQVELR